MEAGEVLKATERLLEGRHGRLGAAALRWALVDLYEFWLSKGATAAGVDTADPGVALVAVGGLGRRELVPFSDLDLVLVHNGNPDVGKVAAALWYPLWAARCGAGDAELPGRLASAARDQWRRTARQRLPELADSVRERWRRSGEVAQSA